VVVRGRVRRMTWQSYDVAELEVAGVAEKVLKQDYS